MTDGSPEEAAVRTSLVAGFTGSVIGSTLGPPGAIAGGVTLGTAGYVYGYNAARHCDGETEQSIDVDTA